MTERELTDAEKLAVFRHGAQIDQELLDHLLDHAAALYTESGVFAPHAKAIADLWDVIQWHRTIGPETPDPRDSIETGTLEDVIEETLTEVIERSSFGTPEVKAARDETPPEVRDAIMEGLADTEEAHDDVEDR